MGSVRYPNVLFDLDGTLTDPGPGFLLSIKHALETLGATVPTDAELAKCIGPPLEDSFQRLLDNKKDVDAAIELYRARYSSVGLFENSVYDGVVEALGLIVDSGARVFLATSKPKVFADRILQHFELAHFFSKTYGSQLDGTHANKSHLLQHLLETESLLTKDTMMIGDRLHDIHAANAHALSSVGVLWGYGSQSELSKAGAGQIIAAPVELPKAIGL